MNAVTRMGAGINACSLYFAYEDWQGNWVFNNYRDAKKQLGSEVYLTGFLHNRYYNCTERVDSIRIERTPSVSRVKRFIHQVKKTLEWEYPNHYETDCD